MPRNAVCSMFIATAVWLVVGGCVDPTSLLNPAFVNTTGATDKVATLPGDAPQLLVSLDNQTGYVAEMTVSYRDEEQTTKTYTQILTSGKKSAQAIPCVVSELTLGDVANLDTPGAIVRLGAGTQDDPYVVVETFGVLLQNTANYNCGDGVTFVVQPSGATSSGFITRAYIQRSDVTTSP